MTHAVIEGVPHINGKPAIKCDENDGLVAFMKGSLAPWKCPECDAHLSGSTLICMNGCHLSNAAKVTFSKIMEAVSGKVRSK